MEEIVLKCLKACDSKGASTIAFPALGAGALKYPPKVVAKAMINAVQNYNQTNRTTCIKEVKFVLYMDETYKEFEHTLSRCSKPAVMPPFVDSSASRRTITPAFASDYSRSIPSSTTVSTTTDSSTSHSEGSLASASTNKSHSNVKAPIKICKGKLLKEKV